MTHSYQPLKWKALGLLACALAFGISSASSAPSTTGSPGVRIIATDPSALVGSSTGAFTLVRFGDANVPLSVNVVLSGTASNGVDYATIDSVQNLDPGVLALDVIVQPVINPANRGNKTVVLTLQSNAAYNVIGKGFAKVKIVDDLYDVPPPSVTMTSPVDGSASTLGTPITLTADTSDSELPIQSVTFFVNDVPVGHVTSSPFTLQWTAPRAGKYAIFARAVDESGKSGVSTPVNITVSSGPVVTVTPPDGSAVFQGEQVQLEAVIGDPNEQISSVTFTVNGQVLGTVTTAPFIIQWPANNLGTFTIQATAVDAKTGKKGVSSQVHITVVPNGGV